jgi:hypothetical protein
MTVDLITALCVVILSVKRIFENRSDEESSQDMHEKD